MDERARELEDLYRRRHGVFRDVLTGVTGRRELARDVVQDAFAVALRERRKFRGDGSLEAWVWRIAYRLALKARRDDRVELGQPRDVGALDTAMGRDVRAAIRRLSPQRRLVVFLRYFADLSYADIAAVCDIKEGTVAATLAQAREELAGLLTSEVST